MMPKREDTQDRFHCRTEDGPEHDEEGGHPPQLHAPLVRDVIDDSRRPLQQLANLHRRRRPVDVPLEVVLHLLAQNVLRTQRGGHIIKEDEDNGRVVKGVGHLGHDEAVEAGGRESDPRPVHYSRMSF